MNVKLFLSIFFLATISLGSSCRKNKEPVTYIPLDTTFLSYCAFPEGSWWVYEEINTKQKDSLYVAHYDIIANDFDSKDFYFYQLTYHIYSKADTFYFSARPYKYSSLNMFILIDIYNGNNITLSADRFFYPFTPYDTVNNILYIKNIIDTMSINNILYENIVLMDNTISQYGNQIKTEYYCKNVGVIRREYFDGQIWQLLKHHINN